MSNEHTFETVDDFLMAVGRAAFQRETGFSTTLVTRAKSDGAFPAHWLWKVRDFCKAAGHAVPENLFRGHPDNAGVAA